GHCVPRPPDAPGAAGRPLRRHRFAPGPDRRSIPDIARQSPQDPRPTALPTPIAKPGRQWVGTPPTEETCGPRDVPRCPSFGLLSGCGGWRSRSGEAQSAIPGVQCDGTSPDQAGPPAARPTDPLWLAAVGAPDE